MCYPIGDDDGETENFPKQGITFKLLDSNGETFCYLVCVDEAYDYATIALVLKRPRPVSPRR